jgi:hypothetical protein
LQPDASSRVVPRLPIVGDPSLTRFLDVTLRDLSGRPIGGVVGAVAPQFV